jgi:hypothetical protein
VALAAGVGHASTVRPDPSTLGAVGERGSHRESSLQLIPGSAGQAFDAGRRGEREGSIIGTRYRHISEAMQARVVAVIAERLAVALAAMPQMCLKTGSGEEEAC